jgi:hypothetical protein
LRSQDQVSQLLDGLHAVAGYMTRH